MRKVFVTGMGLISALGNSVESVFNGLIENRSGVVAMPEWSTKAGLFTHVGAPAEKFDSMKIPRAARRTMSRMSEMATLATMDAIKQSGLNIAEKNHRALMCMGCSGGSPEIFEEYFRKIIERGGPEGQMGTTFFKVMNHTVPTNVASAMSFNGAVFSPSSACATSAQAIILGWELIQSGLYDIVIAGGADDLHYTSAAVFDVVMAASRGYNDRPQEASRPFDSKRDGLVVGEGASVLVLESEENLIRRKGKALAQLESGAYLCSGAHMSQNNATVMKEVMNLALERAHVAPSEVSYINAHTTATRQGDAEEAEAIGQVFGKNVPVSSLKGHFGHSLAACGGIEAIASIKMMERGVLIPTRNLVDIDPACSQVQHVQSLSEMPVQRVLSNNFAFGGINTSLILSTPVV